jgi:putative hydrolase of the HAD superfamily
MSDILNTKPFLFMDLDDTALGVLIDGELRPVHAAYSVTIKQFTARMAQAGFDPAEAKAAQERIDREQAAVLGFSDARRFAISMVKAYEEMAAAKGEEPTDQMRDVLFRIGMSVFIFPHVALPGAIDAIRRYRDTYNVAIVTKGAGAVQHQKLVDSGILAEVEYAYVLEHKSVEEYAELLTTIGLTGEENAVRRAQSYFVGDSVKSDVNPALALGLNAVHLTGPGVSWSFEAAGYADVSLGQKLKTVTDIRELTDDVVPVRPTTPILLAAR